MTQLKTDDFDGVSIPVVPGQVKGRANIVITRKMVQGMTYDSMMMAVCAEFGVTPDAILGRSRKPYIIFCRHLLMTMAKDFCFMSFYHVGRVTRRTHGNVVKARQKIHFWFEAYTKDPLVSRGLNLYNRIKKFNFTAAGFDNHANRR